MLIQYLTSCWCCLVTNEIRVIKKKITYITLKIIGPFSGTSGATCIFYYQHYFVICSGFFNLIYRIIFLKNFIVL
jgi:hypothetical protein